MMVFGVVLVVLLVLCGEPQRHCQRSEKAQRNNKSSQVLSHNFLFRSFCRFVPWSSSPVGSASDVWSVARVLGVSRRYPLYLLMRKSGSKLIIAGNFLLRAGAKRSWDLEGRAMYNPPTTEGQHYQHAICLTTTK